MINLISAGMEIIKRIIPDKEKQFEAQQKLLQMEQDGQLSLIAQQSSNIREEAKGESWLQRNWRPLTMLTFVGLVVAKWLGLTDHSISEAVELQLMKLIEIGIGGYVVGRSAEKCVKAVQSWKK